MSLARTGATAERLALARRVAAMHAEGFLQREIAATLGIGRSYVSELLRDPEGLLLRARRDSYGGRCEVCGARTTGAGGRAKAPTRCAEHAVPPRSWNRDSVIDAIQRFAAENGRPPTSGEWRTGNPALGYPARTLVYGPHGPFPKWADAIEAAGFPRPTSGRRTIKEGRMAEQERHAYVILREAEDGRYEVVKTSERPTQVEALNEALNGHEPQGKWVAVPGRYWRPRELKPRTVYDWAETSE